MCEATAYGLTVDGEKTLMEMVVKMEINQEKIYLTNLLGETKTIIGKVEEIRLIDRKILIRETQSNFKGKV